MTHRALLFLATLLISVPAVVQADDAPRLLQVDAEKSTLSYEVVHKLHKVLATSNKVEGKLALARRGLRPPIG